MHAELARVWTDVARDDQARVAVVTGGQGISAGGDLAMVERMAGDYDKVTGMLAEMSDLVYNMINCAKPVVSAINGVAVGAGLVVALLADVSICAADARLGDGHVKLGTVAGDHAAILWPLLCGMARARYYLLTGEMVTGTEAERIGLVSKCVPREEVLAEAFRVADTLATGSQLAIRLTKRALNGWLRNAGALFDQSAAYEMLTFMGPDLREGVTALQARRRRTSRRRDSGAAASGPRPPRAVSEWSAAVACSCRPGRSRRCPATTATSRHGRCRRSGCRRTRRTAGNWRS